MKVIGRVCWLCGLVLWLGLMGCRPEMPVTSTITIEGDGLTLEVNKKLYGLTLEEVNHGIDGGLYAELIQNRSFEDGVPPLNCPYDAASRRLRTPNGWYIPFIPADSIPGWRALTNTWIWMDTKEVPNDRNRRSLLVNSSAATDSLLTGVVAEGYGGIPLRKGARYRLSFFAKGTGLARMVRVGLRDSAATRPASDRFEFTPTAEWRRYAHTFTATEDMERASLLFSADSSCMYWLDVVSLFPEETWKGRPNGVRSDLAAMLDSLHPSFIRFPGGSFVEGYTAGTYPVWRETVGDIATRRSFWNVWAYGTTNGMGYHEYLQLCEDLGAEPIYVINSGVTSQSRRPRYEDITQMDKLVTDALEAIAYANEPADSTLGKMRAAHGHPKPFNLKYIEIGSENYGHEYNRRFALFKKAINEAFPEVTVISSATVSRQLRNDWIDSHYYSNERFFASGSERFHPDHYSRRSPMVFIGEFGTVGDSTSGTLRSAIAEACFMIGVEENPDIVRRLGFSPVFGNVAFEQSKGSLIQVDGGRSVASPSYHLLRLFANHRGDVLLKSEVQTYNRPQVYDGHAGIMLFDNSYDFEEIHLNGQPLNGITVARGEWKQEGSAVRPAPNKWNQVLLGDTGVYDCDFTLRIRRTKGSGPTQLRLRDNGKQGDEADFIGMNIGTGRCELFHQAGGVLDSLGVSVPFPFESNRWYTVRLVCERERIQCYVDGELTHDVQMRPLPSLVSVSTIDEAKQLLYVKVVNTTFHDERTALHINGLNVSNEFEVWEMSGEPEDRNTFDDLERVAPRYKRVILSPTEQWSYVFPPKSISLLVFRLDS